MCWLETYYSNVVVALTLLVTLRTSVILAMSEPHTPRDNILVYIWDCFIITIISATMGIVAGFTSPFWLPFYFLFNYFF